MAPICLCGTVFGSNTALRNHAVLHGHYYQCYCEQIFGKFHELQEHQQDSEQNDPTSFCTSGKSKQLEIDYPHPPDGKRVWCGICSDMRFRSPLTRDKHLLQYHKSCPVCYETFATNVERDEHQQTTEHCCCIKCNIIFKTLRSLMDHIRSVGHETGQQSDEDHELNVTFEIARAEEANLWCEECDKVCATLDGLHAHKRSSKAHRNPLVSIRCTCGRTFDLVSGFVAHLESSTCKSGGMSRDKLNATVYKYDQDRTITMSEHADFVGSITTGGQSQSSVAPLDSASNLAKSLSNLSLNSSRVSEINDQGLASDGDLASISDSESYHMCTPDVSGSSSGSISSGVVLTPQASDTASTLGDEGVIWTPPASVTVDTASSNISSNSGVLFTPTASIIESEGRGLTFTPSASSAVSANLTPSASTTASCEWSFLDSSHKPTPSPTSSEGSSVPTLRADPDSGLPSCSKCERTFMSDHALRQHINSGVHGPKLFHCPTGAAGPVTEVNIPDRKFTSLSGLVQHIENGHCGDGDDAFMAIAGLLQGPMQKKVGMSMKLLNDSADDTEE